jgi:hypothetical protein
MTWASTLAYKGNKNILEGLNWKPFVIMKKRLLAERNLYKNKRGGNQKIKKGKSKKI